VIGVIEAHIEDSAFVVDLETKDVVGAVVEADGLQEENAAQSESL
jgi:hypothetical protein